MLPSAHQNPGRIMDKYPPAAKGLGEYLKRSRISGTQAAEMLQVTRRTVGYWIEGKVTIPFPCWFTLRTLIEGKPPIEQLRHDGELWDIVSPSLAIGPMNRQLKLNNSD